MQVNVGLDIVAICEASQRFLDNQTGSAVVAPTSFDDKRIPHQYLLLIRDDEDWESVDQRTWELHIENRARDQLQLDRPLEALRTLRRRSARLSRSPLYWYEAQALRRNGQLLEMREIARRGLAQFLDDLNWGRDLVKPVIADQLVAWFAGLEITRPPSLEQVRIHIEFLQLLQPLRETVRSDFAGRELELETLRSYVTSGGLTTNLNQRPPLLIYGRGGTGKSTLVGKFLLDHLQQLPFVYIDCDSPLLWGASSDALLVEVARQFSLQFPASYEFVREKIDHWQSDGQTAESNSFGVEVFESLLRRWVPESQNILFFLDHLEKWPAGPAAAYEFLRRAQSLLPRLRPVVVSRDIPLGLNFEVMQIGTLNREAALAFLAAQGIVSAETRSALVGRIGYNPLLLRLAADIVRRDTESGLAALEALPEVSTEYLFHRLLNRVVDPELRKIVRMALHLRRITPDLIREVLVPGGNAPSIYQSLEGEIALFTETRKGLESRSDVRRLAIPLLRESDPALGVAINEAAVRWYTARPGIENRAEEIYHRLALGESAVEIDKRWVDGVENYLRGAEEELADPARLYLAARLGIVLEDAQWQEADQVTWERFAALRVREWTEQGRYQEALALMRTRATRLAQSPLFALEAEILLREGSLREALSVARTGLEQWPNDPNLPSIIARCEADTDLHESVTSVAPGSAVPNRAAESFLLRDVDRHQLIKVLGHAFPYSTDLLIVLQSINVPAANFIDQNRPHEQILQQVVIWLESTGRLNEFLTAAATYSSPPGELRSFLDEHAFKIETSGTSDPFAEVLLPGGQPFLNRHQLRAFLRQLVKMDSKICILSVNGPPKSGKTYTFTGFLHREDNQRTGGGLRGA